jgi:adenylate cyclase
MTDTKSNQRKKAIGLAVITAVSTAVVALALQLGIAHELESRTWDWRLEGLAQRTPPDSAIKLIVVDQASLDFYAREESIFWQWPREMYEPIVRFLTHAQARGVAFDVLYTEPSSYGVSDDASFAAALRGGLPTVMAVAGRRDVAAESATDTDLFRRRALERESAVAGVVAPGVRTPRFGGVTLPIPEILSAASALGNVTSDADEDGIFRHVAPVADVAGVRVPTLPLALYLATGHAPSPTLGRALDSSGRLAVRFSGGARTYPTYSVRAIIQSWLAIKAGEKPILDPAEFAGSLVFVGMVAPGLLDLRPIPLARDYPGVEFNATVLGNLRAENFVRKVPLGLAVLGAAVVILLTTASALFLGRVRTQVLAVGLGAGFAIVGAYALALLGWWMPLVVPFGGIVCAVIAALALQYELEGRQHRFIKDAFRFYVSPSVIDQIIDDPSHLSLGGTRRELSIFFSDIAGFTSISERIEAAKLSALLNRFLSEMTDIIMASGGTVDKYVGDAIVAFWNAPIQTRDHALRAVRAAIDCQNRLAELRTEFSREYGVEVRMRVGLHTGIVSVGNFGSRNRFNYTMIGDAANLASRLEGANKAFGTEILVSASTVEAAGDTVSFRKIADIRVVGKSELVSVFEPLFSGQQLSPHYVAALARFEAGDRLGALAQFKALGEDRVAQAYVARIERDAARDLSADELAPAWNLSEK